jgi:hypothetical protein
MNQNQRIALAEKNLQVKDLGFKLNLHPNHVSNTLAGRCKCSSTRKKICEILEREENFLWPQENR